LTRRSEQFLVNPKVSLPVRDYNKKGVQYNARILAPVLNTAKLYIF
jgi:hypothetical protein